LDRKSWFIVLGTTAALATAAVVTLLMRRARLDGTLSSVPELITDCYDKIKDIEADLTRLRTPAQAQPAT
jgi:hypothetical protein